MARSGRGPARVTGSMARHPEWFERLEAIAEALRDSPAPALGRPEIRALFQVSERDAIRLLHRFGGERRADTLSVPRSGLLPQLEALRGGAAYQAFLRQRQGVAQQLTEARNQSRARQFRVRAALPEPTPAGLADLPATCTWRRVGPGPGRFEIRYENAEDLLWQLAEFLEAAGGDRAEFFRGTEPAEGGRG